MKSEESIIDAVSDEFAAQKVMTRCGENKDSSLFTLHSSFKKAQDYYQKGNECRRSGDWQGALNNYIRATELDPDSPAAYAKEMLNDIMSYYNKDCYNP